MSSSGIVNIRGKEYQTVALRVQMFREKHGLDLSISTKVLYRDDAVVVVRARIQDKDGRVLATGHAEELRSASQINQTSALENAETSAIGRALAALGLAGTEYATADEVAGAIVQQNAPQTPRKPAVVSGDRCPSCSGALDERTAGPSSKNPGKKYLLCPKCLDDKGKPGKFIKFVTVGMKPPPGTVSVEEAEERQREIAETSGANEDLKRAQTVIDKAMEAINKAFPDDADSRDSVILQLFSCKTFESAKRSHGVIEVARALKDHLVPTIADVKKEKDMGAEERA